MSPVKLGKSSKSFAVPGSEFRAPRGLGFWGLEELGLRSKGAQDDARCSCRRWHLTLEALAPTWRFMVLLN